MTKTERAANDARRAMFQIRRLYRRDIVSVKEVYRTKRNGTPVGEATLTCGHITLVDMDRPAKWRVCWTCHKAGLTVMPAPSGSSGDGSGSCTGPCCVWERRPDGSDAS